MRLRIAFDREIDGRWIAEVRGLGVVVYGRTRREAERAAKAGALYLLAYELEAGTGPNIAALTFSSR